MTLDPRLARLGLLVRLGIARLAKRSGIIDPLARATPDRWDPGEVLGAILGLDRAARASRPFGGAVVEALARHEIAREKLDLREEDGLTTDSSGVREVRIGRKFLRNRGSSL